MTLPVVIPSECRVGMRRLYEDGERVHSVVTDPPYHLESVVKRFGKDGSAPAKAGSDGRFARQSKGFMGRTWDGSDASGMRVSFDPETWRCCYDLLLPGGYILAFGSPRTYHRLACAIEDAGFITHPFLGWAYGQGFPKAHDISKARQWSGWYYGGQALKPALEPIYFGQKPFSEKRGTDNVLKWGAGAVNVDGCRVGNEGATKRGGQAAYPKNPDGTEDRSQCWARTGHSIIDLPLGRWPANFLHDGSDDVLACFPRTASGTGAIIRQSAKGNRGAVYGAESRPAGTPMISYGDEGSAVRFFASFPYTDEDRRIFYHAKANKVDRDGSRHPTVKPIGLLRWLIRLVTPPGGTVLDPFAGSGTTGVAAGREGFASILIEQDGSYVRDIERRFVVPDLTSPMALAYAELLA